MNLKRPALAGLLALGVATLAVQLLSVERVNPALSSPGGDVAAPPQIQAILDRTCYDCHSNQTRWPWYSRVAPVSWLIVHDVTVARKEINFSEWGGYYPRTRQRKLEWMERALRDEKMPPWSYRLMHPGSRLTDADRAALERWIQSALATATTDKSNK